MANPCCANCRFGIYFDEADTKENFVVCRRYPPHPVLTLGERYDPGDTLQGYWPRTSPDDECGEHKFYDGES
jgi:hypothetical protein